MTAERHPVAQAFSLPCRHSCRHRSLAAAAPINVGRRHNHAEREQRCHRPVELGAIRDIVAPVEIAAAKEHARRAPRIEQQFHRRMRIVQHREPAGAFPKCLGMAREIEGQGRGHGGSHQAEQPPDARAGAPQKECHEQRRGAVSDVRVESQAVDGARGRYQPPPCPPHSGEQKINRPGQKTGCGDRAERHARKIHVPEAGCQEEGGGQAGPRAETFRAQQVQAGYRQQAENGGGKTQGPRLIAEPADERRRHINVQPLAAVVLRIEHGEAVRFQGFERIVAVHGFIAVEAGRSAAESVQAQEGGVAEDEDEGRAAPVRVHEAMIAGHVGGLGTTRPGESPTFPQPDLAPVAICGADHGVPAISGYAASLPERRSTLFRNWAFATLAPQPMFAVFVLPRQTEVLTAE